MELEQQLERIEQLKTDKYMGLLLSGLAVFSGMEEIGIQLMEKYQGENQSVNKKMEALLDDYDDVMEKRSDYFYETKKANCGVLRF